MIANRNHWWPAAALAVLIGGFSVARGQVEEPEGEAAPAEPPRMIEEAIPAGQSSLIEKVDPVLVAIQHERAGGSGFIVSEDGYILTNGHVVSAATPEDPTKTAERITVVLHNDKKYRAKVIGHCLDPDVALIKIEPEEPLQVSKFADSSLVRTGDRVFAFGMPTGLKRTLTSGILSNVERTDLNTFTKVFQTDAAINPGNSGGPLFNDRGEVLGLNTYGKGGNNLGFTIPIHVAKVLKEHYLKYGKFRRATIPFVYWSEIYDELAEGLGVEKGILIDHVEPDSPAQKAGIRSGDVLTAVDGALVSARTQAELSDFNWEMTIREIGSRVSLDLLRREEDGEWEKRTVSVTLQEDEPAPRMGHQVGEIIERRNDLLGLGVRQVVTLARLAYRLPREPGVWVTTVEGNSPAAKAGLSDNDVITHVEGEPVRTPKRFERRMEELLFEKREGIRMEVRRGNSTIRTAIAPYYPMSGKKLAILVPEEPEHLDLVRQFCITGGAQVTLVTRDGRELALEDGRAVPTRKVGALSAEEIDGCILLDGKTKEAPLWKESGFTSFIRALNQKEKKIGAIGEAAVAVIRAEPGFADRKMTTAEEFSDLLIRAKGKYSGKTVETDKNLITTNGFDKEAVRDFLTAFRRAL